MATYDDNLDEGFGIHWCIIALFVVPQARSCWYPHPDVSLTVLLDPCNQGRPPVTPRDEMI